MKKMTALLLATAMLASLTMGCAGSGESGGNSAAAQGTDSAAAASDAPAPDSGEAVELRFSWWGSEVRHEATIEAIEYYEGLYPNVKMMPEYSGYDGYQDKLMAQIAGGNAPDIFTCVTEWYPSLYESNALYDITGKIDVSGHTDSMNEACSYDGKLLGVNVSVNSYCFVYNNTLLGELGLTVPEGDYQWEDIFAIWNEVYEKSGGTVYGCSDLRFNGFTIPIFGYTALQKEWPFIWDNDKLTVTEEDIVVYMRTFQDLPEGSLLPAAESSTIDFFTAAPSANRATVFDCISTGTFAPVQSQTEDEMMALPMPVGPNGESGDEDRPGLILSVFSGSSVPDAAVQFIDFFSNDPEAAKILKTTRGVLPTVAQREAVLNEDGLLERDDIVLIELLDKINARDTKAFLPGPVGASEVRETVAKNVAQQVAFGRITPEESGKVFMEEAEKVLDK